MTIKSPIMEDIKVGFSRTTLEKSQDKPNVITLRIYRISESEILIHWSKVSVVEKTA